MELYSVQTAKPSFRNVDENLQNFVSKKKEKQNNTKRAHQRRNLSDKPSNILG